MNDFTCAIFYYVVIVCKNDKVGKGVTQRRVKYKLLKLTHLLLDDP